VLFFILKFDNKKSVNYTIWLIIGLIEYQQVAFNTIFIGKLVNVADFLDHPIHTHHEMKWLPMDLEPRLRELSTLMLVSQPPNPVHCFHSSRIQWCRCRLRFFRRPVADGVLICWQFCCRQFLGRRRLMYHRQHSSNFKQFANHSSFPRCF